MADGMTIEAACASDPSYPSFNTFWCYVKRNADRKARIRGAIQLRETGPNAIGNGKRYAAEDFQRALETIATSTKQGGLELLFDVDQPSFTALTNRARRNEKFAASLAAAIKKRKSRPGVLQRGVKVVYRENALRSSLARNDLWRHAGAALKLSSGDESEDIRMDAIVALLESREINRDEIRSAHGRKVLSLRMLSMDDEMLESDRGRVTTRGERYVSSEISDIYAW